MKVTSEAQIAANRRNAQLSTGPRTQEGKEKSRANALKHGLCASVLVAEDAEAVRFRTEEFFNTLRPQNNYHSWITKNAAIISIKIDRCARMDRRARDKVAIKAELFWEDDRRTEAKLLGEQLHVRPEIVIEQLIKTPQGCEWMMGRWSMLARAADLKKEWSPDQVRLAFDLLGTPLEFREGHKPGESLDFEGRVIEGADDPAAVARREIALLKQRCELVEGLDEANRALAEVDLGDDTDPELRRVRRYEASLHRQLKWCLAEIRQEPPTQCTPRGLMASWAGPPPIPPEIEPGPSPIIVPEPIQEVSTVGRFPDVSPPFDLTDEDLAGTNGEIDIPKIIANRRERSRLKAEARREAKRRKAESLRA